MSIDIKELKKSLFRKYYSYLNDKQLDAILAPNGPVLVIAGAGSGKTTVLVNRISYLVRYGNAVHDESQVKISDKEAETLDLIVRNAVCSVREVLGPILPSFAANPCPPDRILAITFTNKAANEIKERLISEVGKCASEIWAGTFHSVCVRLLRRFASHTEYGNDFIIYDQDDCKKIITTLLKDREIDNQEITPKYVLNVISKAKNELSSPKEFAEKNQGSEKRRICSEIYTEYQKQLKAANAMDFDDLIINTVTLLQENADVLSWCRNKFKYVLVDEYQDTNHAQYLLMRLIADGHKNVMVVGDDDQSIYKFRGAAVENILSFDKQYPDATVIYLEQNYRSTKSIIEAANAVIANNRSRRGKTLWSKGQVGRKVAVRQLEDQEKEAVFIAESISLMVEREKYRFKDFAVLYRTKAQSNILETVFTKSGLPHRLLSGMRFYDHAEVKDILAYLRFIHNKNDFVSMSRIINVPKRGIGQATVDKLRSLSESTGIPVYTLLHSADQHDDLKRSAGKLKEFYALIESLTNFSADHFPSELVHKVIDQSGYMESLIGDENEERRKNVDELVSSARFYEDKNEHPSLCGFLEEIALVSDVDNYDRSSDSAVLMTVHAAKGLEFPVVFLAGMEEGLFPSPQSSGTEADLEEERRLAYVAMTRAKEELFITCCHHRMLYGRTNANEISRFVQEIPENYKDVKIFKPYVQSECDFYIKP